MKRFLIKSLALCLLAQPILANPLMMQGMRAHQSMVVMRSVLNTQKQNAGIFNNNVQKRQFAEITPETVHGTIGILEKCGPYGQAAAAGIGLVIIIKEHRDRKKLAEAPRDPVAPIALPITINGFDVPEGLEDLFQRTVQPNIPTTPAPTPTKIAPVTTTAPSSSLNPAALPGDEKQNAVADTIGAIANSGELLQRGVSNTKTLIEKLNGATQQNSLVVTQDQGGRITTGDVVGGTIAVGAAAEKTAEVVAQKTLWGLTKSTVGPYLQSLGSAAMSGAKAVGAAAVANPGTTAVVAGVAAAVVEPMVQEMVRPYQEAVSKRLDDTLDKMTTQEVDAKTGEIKEVPTLAATMLGKVREEARALHAILNPPSVYDVLKGSEKAKKYAYDTLNPLKSLTSIFSHVQKQDVTPGCALPAKDPLEDFKVDHPKPVIEPLKNIGCGSTTPEKVVVTPQEISVEQSQLFQEKNKNNSVEEKPRITNSPEDLVGAMQELGADYEKDQSRERFRLKDRGNPVIDGVHYINPDRLHWEIEAWNKRGKHLGAIDPKTKKFYKPADPSKDFRP